MRVSFTCRRHERGCLVSNGSGYGAGGSAASTVEHVDRLWPIDDSEAPTGEGRLYLCAIKDACSRRIVGHYVAGRTTVALAPLDSAWAP